MASSKKKKISNKHIDRDSASRTQSPTESETGGEPKQVLKSSPLGCETLDEGLQPSYSVRCTARTSNSPYTDHLPLVGSLARLGRAHSEPGFYSAKDEHKITSGFLEAEYEALMSGAGQKRSNPFGDEGSPKPKMSIQEQIAAVKARVAAVNQGSKSTPFGTQSARSTPPPRSSTPAEPSAHESKLAAARARIAELNNRSNANNRPAPRNLAPTPIRHEDTTLQARGGLGMALHPSLMGDSAKPKDDATPSEAKRPDPKAKQKAWLDLSEPVIDFKNDPNYDPNLHQGSGVRKERRLEFNESGKYLAQAAALRKQAALEDMKKRIGEQARRAALQEDRSEQAFLIGEQPDIEWWDKGLVEGGEAYPDFEYSHEVGMARILVDGPDSIITSYVQHPSLLVAPQDKLLHVDRPLYLTKKEQKKKRRQERSEVLKEHQAKVRLGMIAPDPPKVKKSNLMRVLGEQAVKDPTAMEVRVNREIAERQEKHEETNLERKLTSEQRKEKLAENQKKDAMKGLYCDVYRIDHLVFGKHRYKVDIFAKQNALTGCVIMNPKCCLVIVEGGEHSIRAFRKMMENRTDWTENAESTASDEQKEKDPTTKYAWLQPVDEDGQVKDMSHNRCVLLWEGQVRERSFARWTVVIAELDGEVRNVLERRGYENMWQLAKNYSPPS